MRDTNWVHLFTFPIGAASAALWAIDPLLTVYGALTLFIAHRAFATVAKLSESTKQRQQLAEERADLAEQLAANQIELAKAENLAALGTFSASMAHEVRNYVTVVIGNAQLAMLSDEKEEKDDLLRTIERVSRRTNKIMESLLTFARQREPELRMQALQPVIGESMGLISPDIVAAGIELICTIDAEVPPLLIDGDQMEQVIVNLLSNARDAVREKGYGRTRYHFRRAARTSSGLCLTAGPAWARICSTGCSNLLRPLKRRVTGWVWRSATASLRTIMATSGCRASSVRVPQLRFVCRSTRRSCARHHRRRWYSSSERGQGAARAQSETWLGLRAPYPRSGLTRPDTAGSSCVMSYARGCAPRTR
ncbi:hypothetical protein HC891_19070, partial [Candidatus Gracilibacteria bacterium]|nr:hypothetical protein [Candidatus Gracilibacteria bacterium]